MGGCVPCFGSSNKDGNGNEFDNGVKEMGKKESFKDGSAAHSNSQVNRVNSDKSKARNSHDSKKEPGIPKEPTAHIAAQTFTFRDLAAATKNFRPECLLGEGGFGRVYKGKLESGQVVAVKQLDRNGLQGNREFLVEVLMLSLLHHQNLVNLIGYCADGDQRLLVYEYMPLGSLEDHLHEVETLYDGARPLFKDRRKFPKMADPDLQGQYPIRGLYQALAVAAMCLQEQAATRPFIGDVVTALTYLASQTYDPNSPSAQSNKTGPSTPRHRHERSASNGTDGLDDAGRGGHHRSSSTHKNSPDLRKRESPREFSVGGELRRIETSGGSGSKWGSDEPDRPDSRRDSPASAGRVRESSRNRDLERERAVALAKVWGENWRERKRTSAMGSFDGNE
ncbi:hypothetical protein SASPL_140061 [Salvia splendens]|uniref:Protein kinase domain-containing protein n=1 Tax=Salvia splendens TaxID=180675 RepID=A0A8X8ZC47_SALSN|nr:hypothetical protein SASPL_140061 [Salvia splendens]